MTEVLAIVDMQASYAAATDRELIRKIADEVARVTQQHGRVVSIAYDGGGAHTVKIDGPSLREPQG